MRWKTILLLLSLFIFSATRAHADSVVTAKAIPDGIYDLIVGGEKMGVAVVDQGRFTRPIQSGACTLEQAEGEIRGETLMITIPDRCLNHSLLDLRYNQGPLKFQDSTSLYINTSVSTTDGEKPNLSLASGLFLRQHFVYSDGYLDTFANKYDRGDSRISRDIPDIHSRLTIGDTNTETGSAFAVGKRIGGIKIERNWQQDPDRAATVYYSSSHMLRLTSRSTVEIYRDGQLVDRRELSAGEYDIRNLPVAAYASRLKIRVTDSYGSIKEIEADIINPPRLLSKGTFDYSFGLGAERIGFTGLGGYQRVIGSGYIGYGITDWLSLFAAASDKVVTGTASIATPVGAISGEARIDHPGDWRAAYSYSWQNLGASAEYLVQDNKRFTNARVSVGFDQYGSLTGHFVKSDQQIYGIQYSVSLPWSMSVMSSVEFEQSDKVGYSTGITKQWAQRLSTQMSYTRGLDKSDTLFAQFTFSLDRAKPASAGLQANSTIRDGQTSVQTRAEGRYGLYASVATNSPHYGPTITTATVAGSLACTDGACRVGEPVSGGFAIGDGLEAAGLSGSVIQLPAYSNTLLTASTRTSTESRVVAVRQGQGVRLTATDKINVQAIVTIGGKPANMVSVTWEGGETITGEDGLLWLDRVQKKPTTITVAGKQVILMLDQEAQDGIMNIGTIGF
jgi:outer membrane usher protein FimD/PapC